MNMKCLVFAQMTQRRHVARHSEGATSRMADQRGSRSMRAALPPITALAICLSSRAVCTACEFNLTLSHSVSPSASGGKNG